MSIRRSHIALLVALLFLAGMPAVAQGPVRTPPPAIYQFFDWGTDYQTTHPEYGPIGAMHMILWRDINPAPGVFDWRKVDAWLAAEAALSVTLRGGTVVPRPVMTQLTFFLAQNEYAPCEGVDFWDGTPQWVYEQMGGRPTVCGRKVGHVIEGCGKKAVIPVYDERAWREAYFAAVRAFGERYRDDPRITAVTIQSGLDGETQLVKRSGNCDWASYANAVGGLQYRFQQFTLEAMRVWREAMPRALLLIPNAPGLRRETAELAATLDPPIGMKHAGMWPDSQNHEGIGSEVGTWDMYRVYSQTVPIWVESAYGFGTPEHFYWGWMAGLHYHPVAADVHEEWITQSDPAWLRFVQDHLGRTLDDTPDVWTVLRDREYEPLRWGANGHSGHNGDWTYWLTRTSDNPRMWREELPEAAQASVYARQARQVDGTHPLTVQVDPRVWFAGRPARVQVLAYGTLALDGQPGLVVDAGNGWREYTWRVPAASMITLQGDAYVHRVLVQPDEVVEAPAPTPRPLTEEVRDAAWIAGGVPYNPEAAFPVYAREHGLGNPVTAEFDFEVKGVPYRGQGFAGGVVYCAIGDWGNCRHIAW